MATQKAARVVAIADDSQSVWEALLGCPDGTSDFRGSIGG
jgi:hypothetical protein